MTHEIPHGDILIHAGDFSNAGCVSEVKNFNKWLGSLPHKHKIVIAGEYCPMTIITIICSILFCQETMMYLLIEAKILTIEMLTIMFKIKRRRCKL